MNKTEMANLFAEIPTGNISDAMDDLDLRRQVITQLRPLDPTLPRMVGWAHTMCQHNRRPDTENKPMVHQMEVIDRDAKPGDVVVCACGGRTDICTGGGILALRAQIRGLSGFLIDGSLRDVDEIVALRFPVYLRGVSPIRSKGEIMTYETQCPVDICGVTVCPGDLIVSDATGTIAIPESLVEKVYARAKEIFDGETQLVEALRSGMSMIEYNIQQKKG